MSRIIPPNEEHLFVTGVNESAFLSGYDSESLIWDKSRSNMRYLNEIFVAKLREDVFQMAVLREEEVFFAQQRYIDYMHKSNSHYFDESGLSDASMYAFQRARSHSGKKLILLIRHPECRVDGIEYSVNETESWCSISPAIVKIEKVLNIVSQTFDENQAHVKTLKLEDITCTL